jgi:selenocysteine lyase/cysteine desulfurase
MESLESYFKQFRDNIVGIDAEFESPYGRQKMVYADWIASGRLYQPIEERILQNFGPMVGNTHSESSETGVTMTHAYHKAHKIIKEHVNADENDVIITTGSGMTGVVNKLQRLLGLKVPEQLHKFCAISEKKSKSCLNDLGDDQPVVFLTHMEHHSNHTSWLETIAEVVLIEPDENLMVDPAHLEEQIQPYKNRKLKIGSFSGASNVTGIRPPVHQLAAVMHKYGGYCFVDYAASAPYDPINMHPENAEERLDAVMFSPHKFLGGPGSAGVIVFNKELCKNKIPDQPGGGTVLWTNRWNEFRYVEDIEAREDGGTPPFLQAIRAAYCIKLKEQMGVEKIHAREKELVKMAFEQFRKIDKVRILADSDHERLGVLSFYVENYHHNLIVRLLNDRFGIQVRGGCSCAGTYGHFLLKVDIITSHKITDMINLGDLSKKPGWVRVSLHPTMTNDELYYLADAVRQVVENKEEWEKDYEFSKVTGEYYHKTAPVLNRDVDAWFEL